MYLSSSQRLHYKVVQIFLLLLIAIGASFSQYSTNAGKQYPPQNQQPPSSGHGSIPSTGNPLPPSQGPIPSGNGIPGGNIFPGSGIPSGNIFPGNGGACNPQQNQMGSQSNSPTPQSAGPVNILGGFPQSNGVSLGNDQTPSNSPSFGNGQMPSGEGGSYQQDASASVADFGPRGGFGFRRDDDFNNRDFDRPRWGDRGGFGWGDRGGFGWGGCVPCPFSPPCDCPFGYFCQYLPRTCFSCSRYNCVRRFF
ncbi:hypothetical protein DI09_44p90 [Mitosporidium daphniae]|uniref:Uncharacterized protein n=1 Tax=Mitosporidium daphniae TaxID=1485682 RepID=A0A098VQ36_9MICR|nr:uncharacterized protein DI09_44p90 [Mitosporidium daphniae]KGG51105.1 hypothetical protein DI09_44p90 [Mitosporidium daphniae]|eukprot:XP_013237554.1 uncharacterized protein DI09_44p90 [Mitosporidium daphniae]